MILNNEKTKCETNMTGGTAFTIQANAKMFKILSNSMYSNKEKAIIREISCNAYDANIDAGNGNIPIDVHLPNALEPYLSIKDSGTGLTPKQMTDIYTQYGNSTKTNDNRMIGALGLGSKSPFSYIDSFTVISITEGIKNTYSCYIDGNGEPQLQPFGTGEETDEQNGVEVTFPVKQEDFTKFREEAEIVYRPFEVKPNVRGNKAYEVKSFSVLLSSGSSDIADWQLVQPENNGYYRRTVIQVAVQGNIEYPINLSKIEEHLSKNARAILQEDFRLHFNIGELDIAASREELGYDKTTINNIVNKLEKMANEIEDVQNKKLSECESEYKAKLYINKIKRASELYQNFEFHYNGKIIDDILTYTKKDYEIVKYTQNRRRISREVMGEYYYNEVNMQLTDDIVFVYDDEGKKTKGVTKARSLVNSLQSVYFVQDESFFNAIDGFEYIKTSDIKLEKVKSTKTKGKFFKYYYHSSTPSYNWNNNYASADELSLDLDDTFYYIEIKGQKPVNSSGYGVYDYYSFARDIDLIDDTFSIIGVSTAHTKSKEFSKYDAIDFIEYIKEKIENSEKFKDLVEDAKKYTELKSLKQNLDSSIENLIKSEAVYSLPEDNLLYGIKKDYDDLVSYNKDKDHYLLNKISEICLKLGMQIKSYENDSIKEIDKKYPLIGHLGWRVKENLIIDYVKGQDLLIASQNKNEIANQTEITELSKEGK